MHLRAQNFCADPEERSTPHLKIIHNFWHLLHASGDEDGSPAAELAQQIFS